MIDAIEQYLYGKENNTVTNVFAAALEKKAPAVRVEIGKSPTKQILIPEGMKVPEAIEWLQRYTQEAEKEVSVSRSWNFHFNEGYFAVKAMLEEKHGAMSTKNEFTLFGEKPPTFPTIKTGPKATDVVSGIMGCFYVPNIKGFLKTGYWIRKEFLEKDTGLVQRVYGFHLGGKITESSMPEFNQFCAELEEYVRTHSIYRAKALTQDFDFLDLGSTQSRPLFHPETSAAIEAEILTPIRYADQCIKNGVEVRRSILFSGKYGTGKTLTAYYVAREAIKNGWTFMLLNKADRLAEAYENLSPYDPSVLFVEDIDTVTNGSRSEKLNEILNTVDGIMSKSRKIILVMTTNHKDTINNAFRRNGRIDSIIEIQEPDADTIKDIVRLYAPNVDGDLDKMATACKGMTPSMIHEAVKRGVLYGIARNPEAEEAVLVSAEDIANSAINLKPQMEYINGEQKVVTKKVVGMDELMVEVPNQ